MRAVSVRRYVGAAVAVLALGVAGDVFALSPFVQAEALPGGGSRGDSDSGNGQRWGRAGGRSWAFTINQPSNFSAISWGLAPGSRPTLAFDGAVDAATETMTLTTLTLGQAVWTGEAQLPLLGGGSMPIPTRFTLTVSTGGSPLSLGPGLGGITTGVNVQGLSSFNANVLFEMQYGGVWSPVLDRYDSLTITVPGLPPNTNEGPVMTGVSTGFFYEGDVGMSLEDHDAHIAALLGPIASQVAFLHSELPGRVLNIDNATNEIKNTLFPLTSQVDQILQKVNMLGTGGGSNATTQDIQMLAGLLGGLWGAMPCPPEFGPGCSMARHINELATQQSVDMLGNRFMPLEQAINMGFNNINNNMASKQSLQGVSQILETIAGFRPCPAEAPPGFCDNFRSLTQVASQASVNAVQASLGSLATQSGVAALGAEVAALRGQVEELQLSVDNMGSSALELRAVQVEGPSSKHLRWIVQTSRDGALVNGTLTRFSTIRTGKSPTVLANVMSRATINTLAPGLHEVTLELVKDQTDGTAYYFEAAVTTGGATIQGNLLVAAEKKP